MTEFSSIAAAREARGLRLVGLRGVPSPWTEAAKGIFWFKRLHVLRAARAPTDPENALAAWAGDNGVPVVAYENEKLRTGWVEILLLAERLAPNPPLIPADADQRASMLGLSHEICGEMGLGWAYRLLMIRDSLGHAQQDPHEVKRGFPPQVGNYLAPRYGFAPDSVRVAKERVIELLRMFSRRIEGRPFLLGETVTALDVYWATFANLLIPLPEVLEPSSPMIRVAYTCRDEDIVAAISPALRAHQRSVYERYLELPVSL